MFIVYRIARAINLLAAVTLGYSLLSSLWLFQTTQPIYGALQTRIDATSAQAFIYLTVLSLAVSMVSGKGLKTILRGLAGFSIVDATLILTNSYGFFNNPAMDATYVAVMLPLVWAMYPSAPKAVITSMGISLAAIYSAHQTTPYLVLFATGVAYCIKKQPKVLPALLILPVIGYLSQGAEFLSPRGRLSTWQHFMTWWWNNANPLIGTGYGSFHYLGPAVQENLRTGYFLFLHNEYLQILFEGGIIGLTLSLALWVQTGRKIKHLSLFLTYVGLSVAALTQFPMRFFLTQLLAMSIIGVSLRGEHKWIGKD